MCIKYYFHFHLSVPLLHATSGYIKSNFCGFCWAKWVVFSLVMHLNMLTDLITRCHETLPCADEIQSKCWTPFPLGRSGSGSAIRDHLDNGRSNEPTNPCPEWIHRFIWSTMIRVISDDWSWSGSSQRNAPMYFINIANGRFAVKHTCITVISTDLENKRRSQTIRKCKYF